MNPKTAKRVFSEHDGLDPILQDGVTRITTPACTPFCNLVFELQSL
jgi:hypothetical protein